MFWSNRSIDEKNYNGSSINRKFAEPYVVYMKVFLENMKSNRLYKIAAFSFKSLEISNAWTGYFLDLGSD